MTDIEWLLLRAHSLLDDLLAMLPKLSGVFDTKVVVEHILDLLQAETRNLRVEKVCNPSLAHESSQIPMLTNLQISTHPIPQIAA